MTGYLPIYAFVALVILIWGIEWRVTIRTERKIIAHITARMKTVSPSLSAEQALEDLRMAVESGDYEVTP